MVGMNRGPRIIDLRTGTAPQVDDGEGGVMLERPPLRVLRATDDELAGHDKVLGEIAKATKGHCLWMPPEPAPASAG